MIIIYLIISCLTVLVLDTDAVPLSYISLQNVDDVVVLMIVLFLLFAFS